MTSARFGDNVAPHQRPAVAWYQPDVLLSAARRVLSSTDMLRNRDLRESYEQPLTIIDCSEPEPRRQLLVRLHRRHRRRRQRHLRGGVHRAGRVGGGRRRRARCRAASCCCSAATSPTRRPAPRSIATASSRCSRRRVATSAQRTSRVRGRPFTLAALAQNHDWMDSAATFNRYFVRNKGSAPFLGARIRRSSRTSASSCPEAGGCWGSISR